MLRSHLARHLPSSKPLPDGEIRVLAAAAWHQHGIVLIRPGDLRNDLDKQAVINAVNKLYGHRRDHG